VDEFARGVLPTGSDDFNLALAATNLAAVGRTSAPWVFHDWFWLGSFTDPESYSACATRSRLRRCRLSREGDNREIRDRIARREAGPAREFLLDVSGRLNAALVDARLPGFVVENNAGSQLIEVAQQVLDRLGWP
jgi:hypothetical protein